MKLKVFLLCFFLSVFSVTAQVSVSPEHDFYSMANGWLLKGYVKQLPQIKPYPVNVIKKILNEVAVCGNTTEEDKAKILYEEIFNKKWNLSIALGFSENISKDEITTEMNNSEFYDGEFSFFGDTEINELFSVGYDLSFYGFNTNVDFENILPKFVSESRKQRFKNLSFSIKDFGVNLDLNGNVAFGNEKTYVTAGLNKLGFGSFPTGDIILNSSSFQSLNLNFNHISKYFEYSQIFGVIGAAELNKTNTFTMNKFFSFHSLKVPLFDSKFSISYYESVVFGNTFMPGYLMPVPYVILGNVSGFNENLMAGLMLEWIPFPCLKIISNLMIDDFNPKKVLKLDFNSGIRNAFQTGMIYTPLESMCDMISVNYTLVTPYTYTWYDASSDKFNYGDYTNMGICLGSKLPPNSDRVYLALKFSPSKNVSINTISTLARHGNAYESLTDEEVCSISSEKICSDGSLQMTDKGLDTANDYTNFLTQDNVMYLIQGGINIDYNLALNKAGKIIFSLGYTFEYIRNAGVDRNIYKGTLTTPEQVQNARKSWEDSLYDVYNHYLFLGVKYIY